MKAARLLVSGALACLAGLALGAPAGEALRTRDREVATVASEETRGVVVQFEAPPPIWYRSSDYLYPEYAKEARFGVLQETDRPSLPVRVEHVAIPRGAQPTLTILDSQSEAGPEGRVGPVQAWVPVLPGSDDKVPVNHEDEAVYGSDALFPADTPVRLGKIGALREQPFVEVIFTPVLHNPARGSSIVYRSVTVRVDFGMTPERTSPEADPNFEDIYDTGFVNARQARQFRSSSRSAARTSEVVSALAASTALLTPLSTKYKLTINRTGLYRLTYSWVNSNAPDLITGHYTPSQFHLDCQGLQVPITVIDADSNGTFNGNDYIEFYGQSLTWDILAPDDWNGGDYTDDNVYWLYADSVAGQRIPTQAGTIGSGYAIPQDFTETVHNEVNTLFQPLVPTDPVDHWYQTAVNAVGSAASTTLTINTPGVSTRTPAPTDSIKVRLFGEDYLNNYHRTSVIVNTTPAGPTTDWPADGAGSYAGWMEFTHGADNGPATFSQTVLNDGTPDTTNVTVSLPLTRGYTTDRVDVNWIELTYARKFNVDSDANGDGTIDQMLIFSVPNPAAGSGTQIHLTGFSQNVAALYEVTKTLTGSPLASPVRITGASVAGAGPYTFDFQFTNDGTLPPGTLRRFVAATVTGGTSAGVLVPAAVRQDFPSNLHNPATGADWLVIGPENLLDNNPGPWQSLLARRAAQGLRVSVAKLEDVYDEFSWGISDPQAVRDFIAYAYANWPRTIPTVPLTYVVLLGDGSFDYKNGYGNLQNKNLMPTYMRSVSGSTVLGWMSDETYFADITGEGLPDLYLGRLPVHSVGETNAVAQKIINYETGAPGQSWQTDVVFVADNDLVAFEDIQDQQICNWLVDPLCSSPPSPPAGLPGPYQYHRTYERLVGWPEAHDRVQKQFNGLVDTQKDIGPGAAVFSYVGHGGWQTWGSTNPIVGTSGTAADDVDSLSNGSKLPLLLVANCLSGGFTITSRPGGCSNDASKHCNANTDCVSPGTCTNPVPPTDFTYSFGEDFIDTANKGAIGVIAPSHLTMTTSEATIEETFFEWAYGPRKTRGIGKLNMAIQAAFSEEGNLAQIRSSTLLGDPALNLAIPAPKAPTNVTAIPGNHQVTLSWSASPEAATYNVYRSTSPLSPHQYVRIASNVAGTSFTATGLTNCTTYYFAVASSTSSISPWPEGPWSTINDGCTNGGSCLSAIPLNSSAPAAPAGVTATDNENGGTVSVSWPASPPGDEVTEYRVYWDTSPHPPGSYPNSISTGYSTSLLISGLANDTTYYFAVSASNCSRGEGAKSTATPATPHRIEGIKPPNSIDNLMISRSGSDLRLQWTPPATNIYGQPYPNGSPPVTITSQEIYSGNTPNFPIDVAHRIAVVSGSTSFYLHTGAYTDQQKHYYLIVAVDSAGNRSGIGQELPRGVDQLTVRRSGISNLILSWPAVTLDFDGRKTTITKYQLYGSPTPFRRSQIGSVTLVNGNITGTSITLPLPSGSYYYSVIPVDVRGASSPW